MDKITADEVKRKMDAGELVAFVDSRSAKAWDSSTAKLPGAVHVPPAEVEQHLEEIPRDGTIVTYCT